MKIFLHKAILVLAVIVLCAAGCAHQRKAQSAELTALHNGNLVLPDNPDAPKLIYVDAKESARVAPNLAKHLAQAVAGGKFRLADTPSKAGYILHVHILHNGAVSPQSINKAVKDGYGHKAAFHGNGAEGILVDALMVQRRVPTAPRPSRQRLKNISSRNALDSARMRMAIMTENAKGANNPEMFSRAIASELALRLEKKD